MKKISVLSVLTVLAIPGFATEDVQKLYGTEPDEPLAAECIVAPFVIPEKKPEPQKKAEEITKNDTEQVKKIKEIKEVEEIKTVKEIKKVEKKPETKETSLDEPVKTQEIKTETVYNPNARFPHGLQFGVGVSPTSGLNGFIGYNNKKFDSFWAKRFGIRFDFATMSPIKNTLNKKINHYIDDHNGIDVKDSVTLDNFTLDAKHYGAMIDFYPFGDTWFLGGWRISGGYFAGKMDLGADVYGTLNGGKIEFELNDKKYSYDGNEMHARATSDWKFNGPYVGTGFDLGLVWGFKMYFDAGVVFTDNTAKFDLDIPLDGLKDENGVVITEGSAEYNQFIQDKDKAVADVRKEIKDYPYYPLVKIGVMYRF